MNASREIERGAMRRWASRIGLWLLTALTIGLVAAPAAGLGMSRHEYEPGLPPMTAGMLGLYGGALCSLPVAVVVARRRRREAEREFSLIRWSSRPPAHVDVAAARPGPSFVAALGPDRVGAQSLRPDLLTGETFPVLPDEVTFVATDVTGPDPWVPDRESASAAATGAGLSFIGTRFFGSAEGRD
jgi:hypothetical protein